jgi:hypothetical protein
MGKCQAHDSNGRPCPFGRGAVDHHIKIDNDPSNNLHLKGIVYHGEFHFTSRIISEDNIAWYNDGRTTGKNCIDDGHLKSISKEINTCRNRNIVFAVYAQK